MLFTGRAVVDHAHQRLCVIAGTLGRTPDARHAEFAAAAFAIVVGAVHLSPSSPPPT
ncbi:hypothetical protein VARIO8X_20273 [Burkholderiales bacterium 8X]|nr:hypothetical protein VARIO8X_20273 [Burkholderiales bacterium 8X]